MKTTIFFSLITIISMLTFFSCQDESIIEKNTDAIVSINKIEKAKQIIESMGFDTTSMYEEEGFYVVEDDILLDKGRIDSIDVTKPTLRQYRATNCVPNEKKITIGVDYTISTTTDWRTAVSQAIIAYNQNTGLRFIYSETNPDIKITKYSDSGNVCAKGEFPTNSTKPGSLIKINYSFNSLSSIDDLSLSQKTFLLIHEMGHCLGLRHTDGSSEGSGDSGLIQIPGTPSTDESSFMNSGTCGLEWTRFSTGDLAAFNALWPLCYLVTLSNYTDIFVVPGSYLDRSIFPSNLVGSGNVFSGWYRESSLITPYKYSDRINSDITLYPKWRTLSGVTKMETSSYNSNSITFTLDQTTGVSLTARVDRGLWNWSEIVPYSGTGATLGKESSIRKQIDMRQYIWTSNPESYLEHSEYVVLDAGTHWIGASFAPALGPQNGASTKHGITYAIVKY